MTVSYFIFTLHTSRHCHYSFVSSFVLLLPPLRLHSLNNEWQIDVWNEECLCHQSCFKWITSHYVCCSCQTVYLLTFHQSVFVTFTHKLLVWCKWSLQLYILNKCWNLFNHQLSLPKIQFVDAASLYAASSCKLLSCPLCFYPNTLQ